MSVTCAMCDRTFHVLSGMMYLIPDDGRLLLVCRRCEVEEHDYGIVEDWFDRADLSEVIAAAQAHVCRLPLTPDAGRPAAHAGATPATSLTSP